MRFDGIIKTWNDERGFGFITPMHGEEEIFVHIRAFSSQEARPQVGQAVTFEIELDREGKKRAKAVKRVRPGLPARKRRRADAVQWSPASFFTLLGFMILYFIAAALWEVPVWVAGCYISASFLCFLIYWADKSAAMAGEWRVQESMLLIVGLACGWPGAILAQQFLRHKTSKASFQTAFWVTVVINVAAFIALSSPIGQIFLQKPGR